MTQDFLQVFIDLGSSVTKNFYLNNGKLELLLMPPEVALVSKSRLDEFVTVNSNASVETAAWLQLPDQEGIVTVGKLAENFRGDAALTQRKAQPGLFRVLAAISVLRELLKLGCNQDQWFKVLPTSEPFTRLNFQNLQLLRSRALFSRDRPLLF